MTPQLNCLRKMSPVLTVSIHIYGISMEINGKMFILKVNVIPQIDHLGKMSPGLMVSTHIYGISKKIDGKTFIFGVNLGM